MRINSTYQLESILELLRIMQGKMLELQMSSLFCHSSVSRQGVPWAERLSARVRASTRIVVKVVKQGSSTVLGLLLELLLLSLKLAGFAG